MSTEKMSTLCEWAGEGYRALFADDRREGEARFMEALAAHDRQVAERAWDRGYQQGAYDTLGSPRNATENPYRADSLAPRPGAPDRTAPGVSVSGDDLRQAIDLAIPDDLPGWRERYTDHIVQNIHTLGVTVTDGGA